MKRMVCLILCLLLTGCTKVSGSLQSRLEQQISAASEHAVNSPNSRKTYYSYYLDPSIGRISSTETGNVFSLNGVQFVMNLDVASIINEKYYPDSPVLHSYALDADVIAETSGKVKDRSGEELAYNARVCQYQDDLYVLNVDCGYIRFESLCGINEAPLIAARMIEIARSVTVSAGEVLAAYTTLEGIDYAGTPVELFEDKAPENGSIEELLVGYEGRSSQSEDENEEPEALENDE